MTKRSIPGKRIVDPVSGRAWAVHPDWPKCRLESPEAKAAHNLRTTDPEVLAKIKATAWTHADCGCERCAQALAMAPITARYGRNAPYHWNEAADEMGAWLRAHKQASKTWPQAYWDRLYPCIATGARA